jgi:hypothetical protein
MLLQRIRVLLMGSAVLVLVAGAWDATRPPVICAPPGWSVGGYSWVHHGQTCSYATGTPLRFLHVEEWVPEMLHNYRHPKHKWTKQEEDEFWGQFEGFCSIDEQRVTYIARLHEPPWSVTRREEAQVYCTGSLADGGNRN